MTENNRRKVDYEAENGWTLPYYRTQKYTDDCGTRSWNPFMEKSIVSPLPTHSCCIPYTEVLPDGWTFQVSQSAVSCHFGRDIKFRRDAVKHYADETGKYNVLEFYERYAKLCSDDINQVQKDIADQRAEQAARVPVWIEGALASPQDAELPKLPLENPPHKLVKKMMRELMPERRNELRALLKRIIIKWGGDPFWAEDGFVGSQIEYWLTVVLRDSPVDVYELVSAWLETDFVVPVETVHHMVKSGNADVAYELVIRCKISLATVYKILRRRHMPLLDAVLEKAQIRRVTADDIKRVYHERINSLKQFAYKVELYMFESDLKFTSDELLNMCVGEVIRRMKNKESQD